VILRRLEGSRFSEIVRLWEGETVAVLAGGPSLTPEGFAQVAAAHAEKRLRCIAVNDSYLSALYAEVLYGADASWHAAQLAGREKPQLGLSATAVRDRYATFEGQICSAQQNGAIADDVHVLAAEYFPIGNALTMPAAGATELVAGRNSAHQALNIAVRAGAARVLLLGVDGGPLDGVTHHHGGHGAPVHPATWEDVRRSYSAAEAALAARGVAVINCSPRSNVEAFPKMELADALRL